MMTVRDSLSAAVRRRLPFRVVLGVLVAVVWIPLMLFAGAFLSWLSEDLGWLWGTIAQAPGLLAAAWLIRGKSWVWLTAALVLSLAVGLLGWFAAPPTHERVAVQAQRIVWPADWQQTDVTEGGSTWCFKGCPEISYSFIVPGGYDTEDAEAVKASFAAAGWSPISAFNGLARYRSGRWSSVVQASPDSDSDDDKIAVHFTGAEG